MTNSKTSYTFADLNDSQKQRVADRMLSDHPVHCNSTLVEYVLSKSLEDTEAPFCHDDITNNEYYGSVELNGYWEELTEDERDEKQALYEHLQARAEKVYNILEERQCPLDEDDFEAELCYDHAYDVLQEQIEHWEELKDGYQETVDNLESMDFDQQPEIYQWFSCSDWLIRALDQAGECTLDNEFWGRQAYGQSIVLDGVIQRIAFEYACDYNETTLTREYVEGLS